GAVAAGPTIGGGERPYYTGRPAGHPQDAHRNRLSAAACGNSFAGRKPAARAARGPPVTGIGGAGCRLKWQLPAVGPGSRAGSGVAGDGAGAGAGVVLAHGHLRTSAGDLGRCALGLGGAVAEQPGLSFAVLLRQLRAKALLSQEGPAGAGGGGPRAVRRAGGGVRRAART